jgi:hypothetical protein
MLCLSNEKATPDSIHEEVVDQKATLTCLISKESGGEFSKTCSYELVPFTFETPIKTGLKNAFFPFPKKHKIKLHLKHLLNILERR